jgi:hypothetical protein
MGDLWERPEVAKGRLPVSVRLNRVIDDLHEIAGAPGVPEPGARDAARRLNSERVKESDQGVRIPDSRFRIP